MPLAPPVTMIFLSGRSMAGYIAGPPGDPSSRGSEVALADDAPVRRHLVEERHAGRDLQLEDLLAGQPVEVHDEGAQRVAVRDHEHVRSGAEIGQDAPFPVGQDLGRGVGQALAAGGPDVVAPPPEVHLLGAEALRGLRLVQALEVTVHALVQGRIALGRQRADPGGSKCDTCRLDRAHQDRGVQLVAPAPAELLAGLPGFGLAARRERHVDPAREAVLEVPLRLSVTEKDQLRSEGSPGAGQRRLRFFARSPRRLPPRLRKAGGSGSPKRAMSNGSAAVGLMGRGARGGGLSSASFTRSRRPRSSKAANRRMASAARAGSLNCANANPRALPVTRSVPSRTRTCGSISVKALRSSSSVVSKDKLPIKTVDEMVSSSLGRFFDASSLPRVLRPLKPGTVPHQMRDPQMREPWPRAVLPHDTLATQAYCGSVVKRMLFCRSPSRTMSRPP